MHAKVWHWRWTRNGKYAETHTKQKGKDNKWFPIVMCVCLRLNAGWHWRWWIPLCDITLRASSLIKSWTSSSSPSATVTVTTTTIPAATVYVRRDHMKWSCAYAEPELLYVLAHCTNYEQPVSHSPPCSIHCVCTVCSWSLWEYICVRVFCMRATFIFRERVYMCVILSFRLCGSMRVSVQWCAFAHTGLCRSRCVANRTFLENAMVHSFWQSH